MTDNVLPDGTMLSEVALAALQDEAKAKVRRMLEMACIPAQSHAESSIKKAIEDIVAVYVKYGYMRNGRLMLTRRDMAKVDAILADLRDKLHETIDEYATADTDNEDAILVLLGEKYAGMTCDERIRTRVDLLYGRVRDMIEDETIREGGIVPSDVAGALAGIVGVGALLRLVGTEVTRAWQYGQRIDHRDARYVHVFRGSSYICDLCDDVVAMGWQPVESATIPPIHANCRCYCVYV